MDWAQKPPSLFHPDLIYKLNSKRWLAVCPVRSANDTVIDCEIKCPHHMITSTTNTVLNSHGQSEPEKLWFYGGDHCKDCTKGISAEAERVTRLLSGRSVPYVLKLTQSLGSVGTKLITTNAKKMSAVKYIDEYIRTWSKRITRENAFLYTSALIMSDYVSGKTMVLNFFVKRHSGEIVFLGACHQLATGETGRQTTAITYPDQDKLKSRYRACLAEVGEALASEGYWGPVGADVQEDEKTGELYVIELNVRNPLSMVLCVLESHFYKERGYAMSLVYENIKLPIPREEFEEVFARELREARIVLLGSTRLEGAQCYTYGMVIAGEGQREIDVLCDRILEMEEAISSLEKQDHFGKMRRSGSLS